MNTKKIYRNSNWAKTRQGICISFSSSMSIQERENAPERDLYLFVGGVHGDEPEGVWLAEALLNRMNTDYARGRYPKKEWLILPCLNPEGLLKNERTNSQGVDLNRNFPSKDWSSDSKAPRYYPGPHSASEPEVQALVKLIELYKPKLIIHFHSWEPCIVYTGNLGEKIAQQLSIHSGYSYKEDIGYPTPGSLGQYGWLEKQTPVICIEEKEGCPREHIWRRFQFAFDELLR